MPVIPLNQEAYEQLSCTKEQTVIPHAGHLFEEVGALDRVADLAAQWFGKHVPTKDR